MATNGTNNGENCDSDDEMHKKKITIVNCLFNHEAHIGVHMNSFKRVRTFQIELEFGSVGF